MVVTRVYKGRFKVPNLSEEFKLNEVDVKFTLDDPSFTSVKEFLEREGSKKIREQLEKYLTLMKEGNSIIKYEYND